MKEKIVYSNRSRSVKEGLVGAWRSRELVGLFAKRNLMVKYKQTVLGPLWLLLMPLIETAVSAFVFGDIVGIKSGTVPYFLFYYVSSTMWSLFSLTANGTGSIFVTNARIFQKVYFPRLVMPLSELLTALFTFSVRFILMILMVVGFALFGTTVTPMWSMIWLLPILILVMDVLALGVGLIFSALTAKYRDLRSILPVFLDLLKYITPVVYTVTTVSEPLSTVVLLNPVASIVEAFRAIVLGEGTLSWTYLLYSSLVAVLLLVVGLILFNRAEKKSLDVL